MVDVRHEQTAGFAAEGWAKVTRRCGAHHNDSPVRCSGEEGSSPDLWVGDGPSQVVEGRSRDPLLRAVVHGGTGRGVVGVDRLGRPRRWLRTF
jgi:hypothetical protein